MDERKRRSNVAHEAAIARALDERRLADATTCALRAYGSEIRHRLASVLRDDADAAEAFARFCEDLWRGIAGFERRSSFRTWAHRVAFRCACDVRAERTRAREHPLESLNPTSFADSLPDRASADALLRLRRQLPPDAQALLELRIEREMSWKQIAQRLAPATDVALSQRFGRLKRLLRTLARSEGIIG